jgi:hypothetical protein
VNCDSLLKEPEALGSAAATRKWLADELGREPEAHLLLAVKPERAARVYLGRDS